MINNNIFYIFSFFNCFLWILFRPWFLEFFLKILKKYRGSTVLKRKSWKTKNVKNVIIYHMWGPPKISTILKPFLAIFTLFHSKNWPYLQKPEFGNLAKTRFWLLLVNNSLCSIPLSCARSEIKETQGDRCVDDVHLWRFSFPS